MDNSIYQLGDLSKVFLVPDIDAKALIRIAPVIPEYIKRSKKKDSITISFIVTDRGNVIETEVISEDTREELSAVSLKALRQWRFEPAEKDGVTIRSKREITMRFTTNTVKWDL
ncbi:energy transducer TonB [Opitutales bacterium]|nr:energy transducer TonB [Opitutales bacterium]